ncbi:MAG TPA: hydroxysqualene dehydroxylase HpnE [Gaiellaceae bacterium]
MSGSRVAVVGGGLAGIAAALECAAAGAAVTLYESRSRLGGATFSVERNGRWLDNGQHVALRCCVAYRALLERLGVSELIDWQPRLRIPVLREGAAPAYLRRNTLPAPLHLGGALLRYAPLRPIERLAALRAAATLRRLDPDDASLDAETFGHWLRAHGQSERAISGLWNLIALPTLNLPADEASLQQSVQVFRTGLLDSADAADLGIPRVPLQQLHGDAATTALGRAGVRIELGAQVNGVEPGRVLLDDGAAEVDATIVAVPNHDAARLLATQAVDVDAIAALGSSPIVNLHVHYDRRVLDEPFAATVGSPAQWLFDRTSSSGTSPGQLVSLSLSGADDEIDAPLDALKSRYLPALERLLPAARDAVVLDVFAIREPRATFRVAPGTRALRPDARTRQPGLYLAGAWTDTGWPATMEGAVRSGNAAAEALLADLRSRLPAPIEPLGAAA